MKAMQRTLVHRASRLPPTRVVIRARCTKVPSAAETLNTMSKSGTITRSSNGTPYSIRSVAILPLYIVDHPGTKAALPLLGNLAYFALASGFMMTDILALRCLLMFGYSGLVGFHMLHPRPLRIPLRWSAFFVAVNVGMTVQLVLERWPVGMSEDDAHLHATYFSDKFSPAQFKWLMDLGERRTLTRGSRLTTEREVCGTLYFVEAGDASLCVEGDRVASIHAGGFVNDVAFQQGAGSKSYGTCEASGEMRVISWDMAQLREALDANPALSEHVKSVLVRSLVEQLLQRYKEAELNTANTAAANDSVPRVGGGRRSRDRLSTMSTVMDAPVEPRRLGSMATVMDVPAPRRLNSLTTVMDAPTAPQAGQPPPTSMAAAASDAANDDSVHVPRRTNGVQRQRTAYRRLQETTSEMSFKAGLEGVRHRTTDMQLREWRESKGDDSVAAPPPKSATG